jgi:amidase
VRLAAAALGNVRRERGPTNRRAAGTGADMSDDLWRLGAGELAALIAKREVSSSEVVEAHLGRIAAVNPALNAVVRILADEARAGAAAADRQVVAGEPLGVLHGVPVTVKENVDVAGTPTTHAVAAFAEAVVPTDAPLVERLRNAGAIVMGRTNLPDFGLRVHTDSSLHGLTRNPWDPTRTTGGSSGGEAAALASGMTPLGIGNDIGGSLRNPAHCCGIASIKPSAGRVPSATVLPPEDSPLAFQLMATDGPMARNVADVRLALSVIAGVHTRDPGTVPVPLELPRPDRFRVAVMANPPGSAVDPAIAAGVQRAAEALADAGYDVVDATPPVFEEATEVWAAWLLTELRVLMPLLQTVMGPDALTFLGHVDHLVPVLDVDQFVDVLVRRRTIARQWASWQDEHPVLLCPVWTQPPFEHGFDIASADSAAATVDMIRCVLPANLLGLPAAVVPSGVSDGLPHGVQIVGARFRDDLCLDAAGAIEEALGTITPIDPVTT